MQNEHDPFIERSGAPEHSMLFYVPPEGGPADREGLISWLVSTARAHGVNPRLLIRHFLRNSEVFSDTWSGSTFFDKDCTTINGLAQYAELAVQLVRGKTPVPLEALTLLSLKRKHAANTC